MIEIGLSDKNSNRLKQLFTERQKIDELLQHTIITIVDASDVEYEPDDKINVTQDFKSINIQTQEK